MTYLSNPKNVLAPKTFWHQEGFSTKSENVFGTKKRLVPKQVLLPKVFVTKSVHGSENTYSVNFVQWWKHEETWWNNALPLGRICRCLKTLLQVNRMPEAFLWKTQDQINSKRSWSTTDMWRRAHLYTVVPLCKSQIYHEIACSYPLTPYQVNCIVDSSSAKVPFGYSSWCMVDQSSSSSLCLGLCSPHHMCNCRICTWNSYPRIPSASTKPCTIHKNSGVSNTH